MHFIRTITATSDESSQGSLHYQNSVALFMEFVEKTILPLLQLKQNCTVPINFNLPVLASFDVDFADPLDFGAVMRNLLKVISR